MEQKEAKDIVIAAVVLAAVFAYSGFNLDAFVLNFPVALIGVSTGFVLHELGHRTVARKFHAYAEFVLWKQGLLLAVLFTLITNGGFVFAAPGAVVIHERRDLWGRAKQVSKQQFGLIALSGPAVNLLLFGVFTAASLFVLESVFAFAAAVNLWLGLFNMIPFPPLDGSKVFAWDKRIWALSIGMFAVLFLI